MHRDPLPGRKRHGGLVGSSDALALARLAADARPIAVVTANALDATRLLEELAWLAPQLRACLLPDWETLPYDNFSPHQDLVSERLATLYRIQRGHFDVLLDEDLSTDFGELWLPTGAFVSDRGELYVCDTYNRRVQVFRLTAPYLHAAP